MLFFRLCGGQKKDNNNQEHSFRFHRSNLIRARIRICIR